MTVCSFFISSLFWESNILSVTEEFSLTSSIRILNAFIKPWCTLEDVGIGSNSWIIENFVSFCWSTCGVGSASLRIIAFLIFLSRILLLFCLSCIPRINFYWMNIRFRDNLYFFFRFNMNTIFYLNDVLYSSL